MRATYQRSWLWCLIAAILVVPPAYGQDEMILVANFMNGNTDFLNSRVYLWNPSESTGTIVARIYTLPVSGPSTFLGIANLGQLGAKSARNIKVAEAILAPAGIFLPYTNDGGNLTVELTIVGADNVGGVAQVFSDSLAFGTYPLLETTSRIIGSAQLADQIDFGAPGSRGLVRMLNSTGTVVAELGASTITDGGFLDLHGSTGNQVVSLGAGTSGDGVLVLLDAGGNFVAAMGNIAGFGGTVETASPSGVTLAQMAVNTLGDGFIQTKNAAGNNIVRITSDVVGGGWFISVLNSSGTQTAAINGSTGLVFGNVKSFIVADPSDSDRMIKYTSLEGPEAAIYVRGTASLVSGRAYIEFPDHFSAMAVPSSITVTLTPRSASSMGLAAVNVSSQGIQVAELGGGRNSYTFDYVAYAVRKGFEDYEVYLSKDQASELTGQAPRMSKGLALPVGPKKAVE